jgi:hypothetical protein
MIPPRPTRSLCVVCRRASSAAVGSSSTSSVIRPRLPLPAPSRCPSSPRRTYATVNDQSRGTAPWTTSQHPTPYEILGVQRGVPYTKRRFYELVKLYHPDKHDHSPAIAHLPTATRVERYRLIVAANDILSDPAKRRLYDDHGLGWTAGRTPSVHETMRHADQAWRQRANNPAGNATWEDWERWYERRDGKAQEPMYMSNGTFATLIVALCMIGAFVQMYRADSMGAKYVEYKARHHGAIAEDMRRVSLAAAGRSRDERVDEFLRDRKTSELVDMTEVYQERLRK